MISTYTFILFTIHLFVVSYSLQTGFTCESIVKLSCPDSQKIIILEVTYSTECTDLTNQTSNYAPSRCIARHREPISTKCNGHESCTIENTLASNPSFMIGKDANCAFQGQSINVEYSCIPELKTEKLPSIDICSVKSLENIREGFIYSPNYPNDYGANLDCSKTIFIPETGHRLKIYAIRLNTKSVIRLLSNNPKRIDDWLEINNNGEKIISLGRKPFSLLYDDIIDASLKFKSQSITTKQDVIGFVLYFIITPIRRSRPIPSKTIPAKSSTTVAYEEKQAALIIEKKNKQSNTGLILIITLLTAVLLVSIIGFLIYKRGNDRRIRYLEEAFQSFVPKTSKPKISEEMKEFSSTSNDKYQAFEHIYSSEPGDDSAHIYEPINIDIIKAKQINMDV